MSNSNTFSIQSSHASIGEFFKSNPLYKIPKYQRSYAWEKDEVNDFVGDLENCFRMRKNSTPTNHFFGGIVSIGTLVPGAINQQEYEIIDGQQRMATFVILSSALIDIYDFLRSKSISQHNTANEALLTKRIDKLKQRFIEFEQEVNRMIITRNVMTLSKADDDYFQNLIRGRDVPSDTPYSHKLLKNAKNKISRKLKSIATDGDVTSVENQMDNLEHVQNIIESDFSLLHMVTPSQRDAYTLFQILNNRGKSLTEGDLLRAKTLELLENYPSYQNSTEVDWDSILEDKPSETLKYLKWIYSSYKGANPKPSNLYQEFLDKFYPCNNEESNNINETQANEIAISTANIRKEIQLCREISDGIWPFPFQQPIQEWDRNRLSLLMRELRHILAMPLLLAGIKLEHRDYSELVNIIERFAFRHIYLCKQHAGDVSKIYNEEAAKIRINPSTYNLENLKDRLRVLQNDKSPDSVLETSINILSYSKSGRSNKPLKYFLLTCEYYYRWYEAGAAGTPICSDKTLVYSFIDTTIEHIYPKNATGSIIDNDLEPIRHFIGNLTFLGPDDNVSAGSEDFLTKRNEIYRNHSSRITSQIIGQKNKWELDEVNELQTLWKDIAMKVFKI